jgi:2-phospho-L-lactate transferase/gluconeogenesis factor (CofD/UPF0052 family)
MLTPDSPAVLALAGGVGGAKLALGLARCLSPDDLMICVNTGDDESFQTYTSWVSSVMLELSKV